MKVYSKCEVHAAVNPVLRTLTNSNLCRVSQLDSLHLSQTETLDWAGARRRLVQHQPVSANPFHFVLNDLSLPAGPKLNYAEHKVKLPNNKCVVSLVYIQPPKRPASVETKTYKRLFYIIAGHLLCNNWSRIWTGSRLVLQLRFSTVRRWLLDLSGREKIKHF